MKGIPKSELIAARYQHEITQQKIHLADANRNYSKPEEELRLLKSEVVKAIQGKSNFSPQMRSELIEEAEVNAAEKKEDSCVS